MNVMKIRLPPIDRDCIGTQISTQKVVTFPLTLLNSADNEVVDEFFLSHMAHRNSVSHLMVN